MIDHWTRADGVWLSDPIRRRSGRRLLVACADDPECRALLEWLLEAAPPAVRGRSGQEFSYGYWPVRIVGEDRDHDRLQERTTDGSDFVSWIRNAPDYWHSQHQVCERAGSAYCPPRVDQLVALSDGVMSGDPIEAVRYRAPDHMTGWYLTTDKYDGDASTLTLEHIVHVTYARPDIAKFVALAPGFRFWSDPPAVVRYDPNVAAAE